MWRQSPRNGGQALGIDFSPPKDKKIGIRQCDILSCLERLMLYELARRGTMWRHSSGMHWYVCMYAHITTHMLFSIVLLHISTFMTVDNSSYSYPWTQCHNVKLWNHLFKMHREHVWTYWNPFAQVIEASSYFFRIQLMCRGSVFHEIYGNHIRRPCLALATAGWRPPQVWNLCFCLPFWTLARRSAKTTQNCNPTAGRSAKAIQNCNPMAGRSAKAIQSCHRMTRFLQELFGLSATTTKCLWHSQTDGWHRATASKCFQTPLGSQTCITANLLRHSEFEGSTSYMPYAGSWGLFFIRRHLYASTKLLTEFFQLVSRSATQRREEEWLTALDPAIRRGPIPNMTRTCPRFQMESLDGRWNGALTMGKEKQDTSCWWPHQSSWKSDMKAWNAKPALSTLPTARRLPCYEALFVSVSLHKKRQT